MTAPFTSEPIRIPAEARGGRIGRADIVLDGLEQAGPSFEGHVFLNNPAANRETEHSPAAGYAGAFHVYGRGAHVEADPDTGAALIPITKRVVATDAVRAATRDVAELTVTIVPVKEGSSDQAPLKLDRVSIVFDTGP